MHNQGLLREITDRCSVVRNPQARELARILRKPHFKSLITTHDQVGQITYEKLKNPKSIDVTDNKAIKTLDSIINGSTMPAETIKMVGIRKNPDEPLGLTVEVDEFNQLVVARILAGGMIDRQGLLSKGDVILAVNGVEVSQPEDLQVEISKAKDSVTLKVGPSVEEEMRSGRLIMAGGGGQVKNGKSLDSGKKLAVSFDFFDILIFAFSARFESFLFFFYFSYIILFIFILNFDSNYLKLFEIVFPLKFEFRLQIF